MIFDSYNFLFWNGRGSSLWIGSSKRPQQDPVNPGSRLKSIKNKPPPPAVHHKRMDIEGGRRLQSPAGRGVGALPRTPKPKNQTMLHAFPAHDFVAHPFPAFGDEYRIDDVWITPSTEFRLAPAIQSKCLAHGNGRPKVEFPQTEEELSPWIWLLNIGQFPLDILQHNAYPCSGQLTLPCDLGTFPFPTVNHSGHQRITPPFPQVYPATKDIALRLWRIPCVQQLFCHSCV